MTRKSRILYFARDPFSRVDAKRILYMISYTLAVLYMSRWRRIFPRRLIDWCAPRGCALFMRAPCSAREEVVAMSKPTCRAPAWVDRRIRALRSNPSNEDGLREAELLDAAFAVAQSAVERSLAALRDRCDWDSDNRRCLGDLSYAALARHGGIARSSFASSLSLLERVGAVVIGAGWNYNGKGYREPNSYAIGAGSFADQLKALRQSGVKLSVPVNVTLAVLAAHDDQDGCSEVTLAQLMTATGLPERAIREFIRGARNSGKLVWLGGNKFRFANAAWGPKPKSDLRGFPFKSDSGNEHARSDSGREIGPYIKSTFSSVEILSSNRTIRASIVRSSRARASARAAADAVALRADRRRMTFEEFIAKASSALNGRALADLDDAAAYDLLIDIAAEVMPSRFIVAGREAGLALFRRVVDAWPSTMLVHQPDMLFREWWQKAEKARLAGSRVSAWRYFGGFIDDMLVKYSQAKHDAEVAQFRAQMNAATPVPMQAPRPAMSSEDIFSDLFGNALDAQKRPAGTETAVRPFLVPAARDEITIVNKAAAWNDQRVAVGALEARLGESEIASMLDEVQGLGLPFGDADKSWGKAGRLRGRQCLLNRLVKAQRRGLDFRWMWIVLAANHANPRITEKNWTGVGEILDAALARVDAERQQMDGSDAQNENRAV